MPEDEQHSFNADQRVAVSAAFKLAGYQGELLVAPITSEDERILLLEHAALIALHDRRELVQKLTQLLRRKVWVAERTDQWGEPIPFE